MPDISSRTAELQALLRRQRQYLHTLPSAQAWSATVGTGIKVGALVDLEARATPPSPLDSGRVEQGPDHRPPSHRQHPDAGDQHQFNPPGMTPDPFPRRDAVLLQHQPAQVGANDSTALKNATTGTPYIPAGSPGGLRLQPDGSQGGPGRRQSHLREDAPLQCGRPGRRPVFGRGHRPGHGIPGLSHQRLGRPDRGSASQRFPYGSLHHQGHEAGRKTSTASGSTCSGGAGPSSTPSPSCARRKDLRRPSPSSLPKGIFPVHGRAQSPRSGSVFQTGAPTSAVHGLHQHAGDRGHRLRNEPRLLHRLRGHERRLRNPFCTFDQGLADARGQERRDHHREERATPVPFRYRHHQRMPTPPP